MHILYDFWTIFFNENGQKDWVCETSFTENRLCLSNVLYAFLSHSEAMDHLEIEKGSKAL